jgi:hypothetical protein
LFQHFVYYYPPADKILRIEKEIGKVLNNINEVNDKMLRTIFIENIERGGDYETREAFYRTSKGKFYERDSYLGSLHGADLYNLSYHIDPVIDSINYTETDNLLHNTAKVGYAARLSYMIEADRRFSSLLLASISYLIAIALILIITGDQIRAVLIAAGWW